MTEFLTENSRRAYPLDGDWPEGLRDRWSGVLVDACVYTSAELGDGQRVSLLRVRKAGRTLVLTVGVDGVSALPVVVPAGLGGFATVHAEGPELKAILAVDGRKADAVALDPSYTTDDQAVGIPFALRCAGGATRRVTSITAQGAAPCSTPRYSPTDPGRVEKSVGAGEDAVLRSGDGIDMEVVTTAPLRGPALRIAAIAAPEASDADDAPVDLMIRGDDCFSVEAYPGAKVAGGAMVPRTEADGSGGVVVVRSTCRQCCQCEDYKDAVDMLRPAEAETLRLEEALDRAHALYTAALAAFDAAKAADMARVNAPDNVKVSATAALSGRPGIYAQSTAEGTRMRLTVTMLVVNMTMKDASVRVGADGSGSGFAVDGYTHLATTWTKAGATQQSGSGRPVAKTLAPGETLTVVATYAKEKSGSNTAERPDGMKAYCAIRLSGDTAETTRSIDVR